MKLNYRQIISVLLLLILISPEPVHAYIGPGAGFALISSLFTLFVSFFLAISSLLTFPIRMLISMLKNRKIFAEAKINKLIIVGLDGLDYELCQRFMAQGKLPAFQRLKQLRGFKKLGTTCPALSPVAWSSFATGVNPGKHNIYDFLMRNPNTYLPELSSSRIVGPKNILKIGPFHIPLGKPRIQFFQRNKSFWKILGEYNIFSHIIRVPITFPPEKFRGVMLSAMCTPDVRGTQGTFTFYSNNMNSNSETSRGTFIKVNRIGNQISSYLIGPENFLRKSREPIRLQFNLQLNPNSKQANLKIKNKTWLLQEKEFSPWIPLTFHLGIGIKVRGICQFYLKEIEPDFKLYVSPINLDPEYPALPISHPKFYSTYLAKRLGSFSTLGLCEDTWGLNEEVLDENAFLKQLYLIHGEREKQFFHVMRHTKRGVCTCVFDGTDRVQHMFYRYLVEGHPDNSSETPENHRNAIVHIYQKADNLIGNVLNKISKDTLLFVLSDHGFKSFVRSVNLNSWLHQHGYLVLKDGNFDAEYFQNVDWSNTKAYAIGLAGIYLNIKGREKYGIIDPGKEAEILRKTIKQSLTDLQDEEKDKTAINRVFDKSDVFTGPYVDYAPDLIIGYNEGYRISWDAAIGKTTRTVFEDNFKAWSGDHCIDPELVNGILFCNHPILSQHPKIVDLAPTILRLFGIPLPQYMDGKPISIEGLLTEEINDNVYL